MLRTLPLASLAACFLLLGPATAQCGGGDPFEQNDSCSAAAYIEDDAQELAVYKSDPDWYRLRVPPQAVARVDVLFPHLVANVDARIWNACGGTLVAEGNTVTDNEVVFAVNLEDEPRDFFLEVFVNPASSGDCNDYELLIEGAGTNIGANYCIAEANSTGFAALMSAEGSLSVAENAITLYARTVPSRQFGCFYYGPQQLEIPFGNGYRCVGPGVVGTFLLLPPDKSNLQGELICPLDLSSPPHADGQILPGSTWYFQAFYRDPLARGHSFDFSDGLALVFQP